MLLLGDDKNVITFRWKIGMPWNYGCWHRRLSTLIFLNWYFILLRNLMCNSRRLVLSFHVASEFIMSLEWLWMMLIVNWFCVLSREVRQLRSNWCLVIWIYDLFPLLSISFEGSFSLYHSGVCYRQLFPNLGPSEFWRLSEYMNYFPSNKLSALFGGGV